MYSTLFLFYETATPEIYTLSLHDALPISSGAGTSCRVICTEDRESGRPTTTTSTSTPLAAVVRTSSSQDRKSTRLNSSHLGISYAVFCLKKKRSNDYHRQRVRPGYGHCCR